MPLFCLDVSHDRIKLDLAHPIRIILPGQHWPRPEDTRPEVVAHEASCRGRAPLGEGALLTQMMAAPVEQVAGNGEDSGGF